METKYKIKPPYISIRARNGRGIKCEFEDALVFPAEKLKAAKTQAEKAGRLLDKKTFIVFPIEIETEQTEVTDMLFGEIDTERSDSGYMQRLFLGLLVKYNNGELPRNTQIYPAETSVSSLVDKIRIYLAGQGL